MNNPYDDDPMAGMSKKDKQKLQQKLTIKEKFEQRLYGQILLNIPKHLFQIFLAIGVVSGISIVIMILNDVKLDQFVSSSQVMDFTKHNVHPLFGFQQKKLNKETKEMLSARINDVVIDTPKNLIPEDLKSDKPSKKRNKFMDLLKKKEKKIASKENKGDKFVDAKKTFIPGHVDHIYAGDVTPKMFYQDYMTVNKPLFVVEGASEWPAMRKWGNQKYLADQTKNTQALNLEWEFENQRMEVTTVETEIEIEMRNRTINMVKEHGLDGFDFKQGMPFIKNLWVTRNPALKRDINPPSFMEIFNEYQDLYLSHTSMKSNRMQKTNAVQLEGEVYICQIQGRERFKMIAPIFKQNMYAGIREELPPGVSPVDLFHEPKSDNIKRFPLLKQAQVHDVTLKKGDCLFIPAWWWVQSKTVNATSEEDHENRQLIQVEGRGPPKSGFRQLEEEEIVEEYADSLTLEIQYSPHSQLYDLINTGIELDLILSDANEAGADERLDRVKERLKEEKQEMQTFYKQQQALEKGVLNMTKALKERAEKAIEEGKNGTQIVDLLGSMAKNTQKLGKFQQMMDMGKNFQKLKAKKEQEKKDHKEDKSKKVSPLKDIATKAQKAKAKKLMEKSKSKVKKRSSGKYGNFLKNLEKRDTDEQK